MWESERERNEERDTIISIWVHYDSKELKKLYISHSFIFPVIIFPLAVGARKNAKRKKVAVAQGSEYHREEWRAGTEIKGLAQRAKSTLSVMPSLWDFLLRFSPHGNHTLTGERFHDINLLPSVSWFIHCKKLCIVSLFSSSELLRPCPSK